ncbi:MAG: type I polyketide synthase, partial [Micromonosporaceae bacterium]
MSDEIAIVGMAGRFPGAADLADFWSNLSDGVESVSFLSEPELASSALAPSQWRKHPDFVPAAGIVDGAELFDNGFFGMSLREARWTDPQQRVFLELAWAAMEDAGIDPARAPGRVSVYAGAATSGHFVSLLGELGDDPASLYEAMANGTANNLATKAAFELRLRGEAVTWHTACSTGLAVVHAGCQSLLLRQSSVAIAGAVRIAAPQHTGYVYQEGMILSRDGHCRAFDAGASGTVPGNGAGVVVLRPLDDALAAGHHIYAVIKGSAINNDGHRGVGYTAPSVSGQAEVISEAMEFADVSADDIGYVEAHGTGTPLGDPIEIAALTRAYRASSARVGDCPIGSVKSNIGHLDTAAGVAGLIKVALMLRHGEIPASLHVSQPNPAIDFADSPFYPNTERRSWPQGQRPRRAGVSSFGIGGTNVHAVLEEAPAPEPAVPSPRPHQLVTLSARTPEALAMVADDLAGRLERAPADLADVAYTRALGRAGFDYRRTLVAADLPELVAALRKPAPGRDNARAKAGANVRTTAKVEAKAAPGTRVVFLFPGQGAAWYGMAGALYDAEPVFAEELDLAVAALAPHLDRPLLPALCHGDGPMLAPQLSHPALFAVEHALARTWIRWGARPDAVLGHSFGEYAAACVAGVWTLADAARLAVVRGRLVAQMPEGAMLAVALDEDALKHYLDGEVALAAVNGD